MSEYAVQTSRRTQYSGPELNNDRIGRRKRTLDDVESHRIQDFNGTQTAETELPALKDEEDKYYQYLLRKSSSNRRSQTEETLAQNGNTALQGERAPSFGRTNNFQNRTSAQQADKQTNRDLSGNRGNVYRGNLGGQAFINNDRKSNSPSPTNHETQSERPDRRPRVKDLRSLFDSGNGEPKVENSRRKEAGSHFKTSGYGANTDQALSRGSHNVNKETIKTHDAQSKKGNQINRREDIDPPANGNIDREEWTGDIVPLERARVFSDPGAKLSRGQGRPSTQSSLAMKGIKLSQEEAKGAWRLSLNASKFAKESSSEEESDSSDDSELERDPNDSRQRISDKKVIEMLQKRHPTGELKKMFDGPEAFNATTKRQSFHGSNDLLNKRDDERFISPREPSQEHDISTKSQRVDATPQQGARIASPQQDENREDLAPKYVDDKPIEDNNLAPKGNIDVSQFIASPSPPKPGKGNDIESDQNVAESTQLDTSHAQADSYKSMYHDFLKKEGVAPEVTPPPQKTTQRYTRESFRRPLYSEDSEADAETLGSGRLEESPEQVIEDKELLGTNESIELAEKTDKTIARNDSIDDLMPKEYDDETHDDDDAVHDSSYDESGSATSPELKRNFHFNYILKHHEDLEVPKDDTDRKPKDKGKRGVRFSDTPHSVHETHHPLDYERGNDDIDPVSSSAEWELEKRVDKMDIFSVDLDKGG